MLVRRLALAALVASTALLVGCGSGGGGESSGTGLTESTAAPSAFESLLDELPSDEALLQQLLFGDLVRLRRAYPDPQAFSTALEGVRLPDALSGASRTKWIRRYGFGIGNVERFISGGFDPLELTIVSGGFDPGTIRRRLRHSKYRKNGKLLRHGKDGSVDDKTHVGQLAKSSLDRIAISKGRLVAASTTALARAALAGRTSLATNDDLALAAHALGAVTAAAILPGELVKAPTGASIARLATRRAIFAAIGVDDGGRTRRTVRIALVYGSASDAEADRAVLAERLAATALPTRPGTTFGDLLQGLAVRASAGRAVVVSGQVDDASVWRSLLEDGDLAVLVAATSPG